MKANTPIYFVLPEGKEKISGGNIYNQFFIEALQQHYSPVYSIYFEEYEQAIRDNQVGMYWVDSLLLDRMKPLLEVNAPQTFSGFILHLLPSLFPPPGRNPEEVFENQEREILQYFKAFLATSQFSEDYLLQKGFTEVPIIVVPPALCLKNQRKRPEIQGIQALMVCNIIPMKGIYEFIQSLQKYADQLVQHPLNITIIGRTDMDEAYANACMELVKQSAILQKIINFTGPVPHEEVNDYYYNSNLFISTSAMETFGMALQEAKAFHLPILAREGGYSHYHIENGVNGYSFHSVSKLTEYLLSLLENPEAFDKLQKTVHQQSETPENYTWDDAARIFLAGIKSL